MAWKKQHSISIEFDTLVLETQGELMRMYLQSNFSYINAETDGNFLRLKIDKDGPAYFAFRVSARQNIKPLTIYEET